MDAAEIAVFKAFRFRVYVLVNGKFEFRLLARAHVPCSCGHLLIRWHGAASVLFRSHFVERPTDRVRIIVILAGYHNVPSVEQSDLGHSGASR